MKIFDDMKRSAEAFKDGLKYLTVLLTIIASALIVIAVELVVICVKM